MCPLGLHLPKFLNPQQLRPRRQPMMASGFMLVDQPQHLIPMLEHLQHPLQIPMQEHQLQHPEHQHLQQVILPMVEVRPLLRLLCRIRPNRTCLCPISLMLILPRADIHNSSPLRLITLDKDNPLPMEAMDNSPTILRRKEASLPNHLNTIPPRILANSLNGDEKKM